MAEVTWVQVLGLGSIPLSALAAYFAWQNYRRRPRLKLYIGDEANEVMYSDKDTRLAYVHATLVNEGKVAAHNVAGRMEFEQGRVFTDKRRPMPGYPDIDHFITTHSDNWVTLNFGSLTVSRAQAPEASLHARSFEESPRRFILPVRVAEEGQSKVDYWFVSDETEGMGGTATLDFTKRTM